MKTKIPRFGTWLVPFADYSEGSPITDLANDFKSMCFAKDLRPSSFASPKDLHAQMKMSGACPEAIAALIEAQDLYLDNFFRIEEDA